MLACFCGHSSEGIRRTSRKGDHPLRCDRVSEFGHQLFDRHVCRAGTEQGRAATSPCHDFRCVLSGNPAADRRLYYQPRSALILRDYERSIFHFGRISERGLSARKSEKGKAAYIPYQQTKKEIICRTFKDYVNTTSCEKPADLSGLSTIN